MSTEEVPRMIIVDDIDSRIRYHGPWFPDVGSQDSLEYLGPPFRSTLHGTQANASLEFSYIGSGIKVYGTNNIRNDSGVLDPTWECFIDGISIGASFPNAIKDNNWIFCANSAVPDGLHRLTINATVMKNQTFWFADIRYVPSASVPLDQEIILVDHTDPQVHYGQGWEGGHRWDGGWTKTNGSILTFDFIGGSISWYGNTLSQPSPATYSIDGQTPINFSANGTGFNQRYFETPQLPVGPHTLEVVYQGKNTSRLVLDHLVVQNGTLPSIATPIFPHATSTTTPSESSSVSPAGAILGSVIGGIALIILGLYFLGRYKRRAAEEKVPSSTPRTFDLELPLLSRADKKSEVLAAFESQPGSNELLAMLSKQSDDTKSPGVGVHKDNDIRMPPDTPAEDMVVDVPPLYSVEDASLVLRGKDISNDLA